MELRELDGQTFVLMTPVEFKEVSASYVINYDNETVMSEMKKQQLLQMQQMAYQNQQAQWHNTSMSTYSGTTPVTVISAGGGSGGGSGGYITTSIAPKMSVLPMHITKETAEKTKSIVKSFTDGLVGKVKRLTELL